jgi:EmrB/QacA subfamily drug resistance transporter
VAVAHGPVATRTGRPVTGHPGGTHGLTRPDAGRIGPASDRSGQGYGRPALVLVLTAAFMVVLDFSIVNVALPSIERELHFAASSLQWVVTGYAITFGGLLVLGGRAADMYGRRRLFIAGLLVFSVASLAGGLASDPTLLVLSRLVQGAGAAMVAPAALSLLTTGFPEGGPRARALGAYGATASLGFVSGQVLGGALVQLISWRAVFLVNVPVGLVAVLLAPRLLDESRLEGNQRPKLDVWGAVLITLAIAVLVFSVSEAGLVGLTSPEVLAGLALTGLAATAFLWVEHRHSDPLVPPRLLQVPTLRGAGALMCLVGLWNGGELLVLSLYLQQVLHDSPLASGLVIAPQGVVGFAVGVFGARLMNRLGLQRLTLLTGAAAFIGLLVLTQLPQGGGYSPVLAAVTLVGFGTAGTAFVSMVGGTSGIRDADQGLVGGAINTSRQIGAAVGAALLPAIAMSFSHTGGDPSLTGDRAAMLVGAIVAGLGIVAAWRLGLASARPHGRTRAAVAEGAAVGAGVGVGVGVGTAAGAALAAERRTGGPAELCHTGSAS